MPDLTQIRRLALVIGLALAGNAVAGSYDDILAAANKDDTAQVVDLLKRGMDVNTADADGNTLLAIAARNANLELLDFLLINRANPLRRNKYGDSPLMLGVFRGHTAAVRRLLEAGAPMDHDGWNALHYAAFGGRDEVLKLLIQRNPDLDAIAPNGQTPLMLAAAAGKLEAVKLLIEADADMDLEDYEGRTALMLATKNGHSQIIEYLRSEGAYED